MAAVRLGVFDWEREDWLGGFYPPDLPDDWRLTYYNTQYACVWLPQGRWRTASRAEVARWVEDTHDDFRFVLEAPSLVTDQDTALISILGDRLGLLVEETDPRLLWLSGKPDLPALSARLRGPDCPTYLLSRDGNLATLESVATLLDLLGL